MTGALCLALYAVIAARALGRGTPAQLLWFCDVALLCTGIGCLLRSRALVAAQLVAMLPFHLAWHVDFWSQVLWGRMLLDSTAYMFGGSLTVGEKALSFFLHTFPVPATGWALLRLGGSPSAWIVQSVQTWLVIAATYLATDPAENVNWVFGAGLPALSPARGGAPGYYLAVVLAPPLLLYLPANRACEWILSRLRRSPVEGPRARRTVVGGTVAIGLLAVGATAPLDVRVTPPSGLSALGSTGLGPILALPAGAEGPRVASAVYRTRTGETALPLREVDPRLIAAAALTSDLGAFDLRRLVSSAAAGEAPPPAPDRISVRGPRGGPHRGIGALVVSDRVYLQHAIDREVARAEFEVPCQLGLIGGAEFVDPSTGRAPPHAAGGGEGGVYAVALVAFRDGALVARSPFYVFRRSERMDGRASR